MQRAVAACPSDGDKSGYKKRFFIDIEGAEASTRGVAQRPLTKSVPSAPGAAVTGDCGEISRQVASDDLS